MGKARIGVVGIGWWASINHIPVIEESDDAKIVAICDLDQIRLDIVGDKFGIKARYLNYQDMLAEENLDGVMISTPHIFHTNPAIAALKSGCHVLVEKPMATSEADGRAIARAARESGKQVLIPTGMNFTSFTAQAKAWVDAGEIGEVRHAICQMGSALEDLFAGEPMLETKDHLFRPPASTWADPAKAGGYAWGQMSHSLAWLIHVSGLTFSSVYCMDGKSKTGVDYYDAAVARASNGATVSLSGSSTVPKHRGMHMDIRIYGTKGMIVFDNERARLSRFGLDGSSEELDIASEAEYDGKLPVMEFAKLCNGKRVINASDGECGARVSETIAAMYRSAQSGVLEHIGGKS